MEAECKMTLTGKCHCGAVDWTYDGDPGRATVCNCKVCRQYGVIWIYGDLGREIAMSGRTRTHVRADTDGDLAFHFCGSCGAVHSWQPTRPERSDTYRMAVNLRLSAPETVRDLPVRRWDGADSWSEVSGTARCVGDYLL